MRYYISLFFSKATYYFMKLLKRNASYFPGKVALKICPDFLKKIDKPKKIIAITGTNGKTTVSNLIADMMKYMNISFSNNNFGSNTMEGISTLFLKESSFLGKNNKEYAVLEVDEIASSDIFNNIKVDYLIITNLFRDSAQRNAHPEFVNSILEKAIKKESFLIVNSQDLMISLLGKENKRVHFSIDKLENEEQNIKSNVMDIPLCPKCSSSLIPEFIRYHHIGNFKCNNCDYRTLDSEYRCRNIDFDKREIEVEINGELDYFPISGDNITDIYNQLSAIALFSELDFDKSVIKETLKNVSITESRFDDEIIEGKRIVLLMAKGKNPIATSRALDYVRKQDGRHAVIIINTSPGKLATTAEESLNNPFAENICWIYENDYEYLVDDKFKQVITGGKRHLDLKLRALLAGVKSEKISSFRNPFDTYKDIDFNKVDNVFILYHVYNIEFGKAVKKSLIKRLKEEKNEN